MPRYKSGAGGLFLLILITRLGRRVAWPGRGKWQMFPHYITGRSDQNQGP